MHVGGMPRLWLGSLLLILAFPPLSADEHAWVLVDTQAHTLAVIQADGKQTEFDRISIGRNGASGNRFRDDGQTPLGEFKVAWVNRDSPYHIFIGFTFPNVQYAQRAYESGLIDWRLYYDILEALHENRLPPQNTVLGGFIGIHGLGDGDIRIHNAFDWTRGCIALTNEQIDELMAWIEIGTRVVVR